LRQYVREEEENPGMQHKDLFRKAVDRLDLAGLNLSQLDPEDARKGLVSDRRRDGREELRDKWQRQR
jgi:hypothetical protein